MTNRMSNKRKPKEKKMIKGMIATAVVFIGLNSFAGNLFLDINNYNSLQRVAMSQVGPLGLDWKVGESVDYTLDMGFIKGTMHTEVRSDTAEGIWMVQDMDLGFMGKQKIEILFNKADGSIKKILANGKEQSLPDASNTEMVEMKESSVTVPAGTFDCIYARILDKKENKETEAWINPSVVPTSGMIKTVAPSQMGKVTVEMTGFNDL